MIVVMYYDDKGNRCSYFLLLMGIEQLLTTC